MSRKVFLQRQTLLGFNQEKGGWGGVFLAEATVQRCREPSVGAGLCGFSGERISVSERGLGAPDPQLLCAGGHQDLRGEVHGPGWLSSALGGSAYVPVECVPECEFTCVLSPLLCVLQAGWGGSSLRPVLTD